MRLAWFVSLFIEWPSYAWSLIGLNSMKTGFEIMFFLILLIYKTIQESSETQLLDNLLFILQKYNFRHPFRKRYIR